MTDFPRCDPEVFKHGQGICALHARSRIIEPWVVKVRAESGQKVDWHMSGGYANILYLGDYAKVRAAIERLKPELEAACLADTEEHPCKLEAFRIFPEGSHGLYRAGDELPDDVIGVDNSGLL